MTARSDVPSSASTAAHAPSGAAGVAALVCRLLLGGLFVVSGLAKLTDPQLFAHAIKAFKILPDHLIVLSTFAVPWTELVIALFLILGWWTRAAGWLALLVLAAFTVGIASVLARGIHAECACFGAIKLLCTGPMGVCHLVRNAILMALAVCVGRMGGGSFGLDCCCRRD
ncbi:MAG: DoxX family membrane protein [Phycisphaerae bacterium]|nr:DoxX family membrane protein [Phycisphaerae bacterium]